MRALTALALSLVGSVSSIALARDSSIDLHMAASSLVGHFDARGAHFEGPRGSFGWRLFAFGEPRKMHEVRNTRPYSLGDRVVFDRGESVVEWYAARSNGIEQGLSVPRAPEGVEAALSFDWSLEPGATPVLRDRGRVALIDAAGVVLAELDALAAVDATGRTLSSTFELVDGRLRVVVDVRGAVYPIEIDPTIGIVTKVVGTSKDTDDFGGAVTIAGEQVVVGAWSDTSIGAVYVFGRAGTKWPSKTALPIPTTAANFGYSVAGASGRILVGDDVADSSAAAKASGIVTLFSPAGSTWSASQTIVASDADADGHFGRALALSGKTLVVGAGRYAPVTAVNGWAYIFDEVGGTFTQSQRLTGPNAAASDFFGSAVAIDGDTLVIGAPYANIGGIDYIGSAHVYVRSGGAWSRQQTLEPADAVDPGQFGAAVAISKDTILVGAPLATIAGHARAGATHVFVRSGTTWSLQQTITEPTPGDGDSHGTSVAIVGDTALIGVSGGNGGTGEADVLTRSGATWTRVGVVLPTDVSLTNFGNSVAFDGTLGVVGDDYPFNTGNAVIIRPLIAATNGTSCADPGECATGFCVEGVCCGKASCAPYSCSTGTCATTCAGTTGCAPGAFCAAGVCLPEKDLAAACAGKTECKSGFCEGGLCCVTACSPYVCAESGNCRTSCIRPTDCASGYSCVAGHCLSGAHCTADGLSSIAKDGTTTTSCAPYRCGGLGDCTGRCDTSADCTSGNACDTSTQKCNPLGSATTPSGGCATAAGSSRGAMSLGALAFAGFLWVSRRRRGRVVSA